jgi:hypothetical protein
MASMCCNNQERQPSASTSLHFNLEQALPQCRRKIGNMHVRVQLSAAEPRHRGASYKKVQANVTVRQYTRTVMKLIVHSAT